MRSQGILDAAQLLRRILIVLLLIHAAIVSTQAAAQVSTQSNSQIAQWEKTIAEARKRLAQDSPDDSKKEVADLEEIRARLASQRDAALSASRVEPFEVAVAEGKLKLLGPVPAAGESEFSADRRKQLETDLYRLQTSQRAYEESYLRSVAAIARLDSRIDELSRAKLMRRAASPLWPGAWLAFFRESSGKVDQLFAPSATAEQLPMFENKATLQAISVVSLFLGIFVATFMRRMIGRRLGARTQAANTERSFISLAIAKDVSGIIVAATGLTLITFAAVLLIGVFPAFGQVPLVIVAIGIPIILAHWLGLTLFAPRNPRLRFISLRDQGAQRAVWLILGLGLAVGLEKLVEAVEESSPYSDSASGVGAFLVLTILSAALYLLAKTIEDYRSKPEIDRIAADPLSGSEFVNRRIDWPQILILSMKASAMVALVLAAVGYAELARWAIIPLIASLFVIAFFMILYSRLIRLVKAFLLPNRRNGDKTLLSAQFALLLIASTAVVPLVALIWGVRPAELTDFIALLRDGVTIGGVTISLGTVVIFFAVFVLGYIVTRWIQRLLQTALLARIDMDDGTRSAIVTGVGYLGIMLAFVAAIGAAGIDLSNLAIIFGALSVGIGFGMQSVVSNFVSGIIMLIERPIKEGDSIVVGEYEGIVEKISVRATRIQSFDHDDVIIPNSELIAGTVRNRTLTDRMTRIECAVGIAYDADVNVAFDILYEVAKEHPRTVQEPPPKVVMEQLGDSALLLRLYCFIDEVSAGLATKSEIYVRIVERFRDQGIGIPFPQREVSVIQKG